MVMGNNSCSKGSGFKSQRRILDGHFFLLLCCKNYIVCLKRPKINEKEAGRTKCQTTTKIGTSIIIHLDTGIASSTLRCLPNFSGLPFWQRLGN